jgi:hypothetical protein
MVKPKRTTHQDLPHLVLWPQVADPCAVLVIMKCLLLAVAIALSVPVTNSFAGKCTGDDNCTACKTCEYCKHCAKEGGTCGVKKRLEKGG